MAGRRQEEDCLYAFQSGNKLVAEQLLPSIPQPAAITTTFKFTSYHGIGSIGLSTPPSCILGLEKCRYCATYLCISVPPLCKDAERAHLRCIIAAYNGHLEVAEILYR